MSQRLQGKRVLVTQADDYMGPATVELFSSEGAQVMTDTSDLTQAGACETLIEGSGQIDILVANLAHPTSPESMPQIFPTKVGTALST